MDKVIAIAIAAALLAWFFWPLSKMNSTMKANSHEMELLSRCTSDQELLERLINRELKRDLSLSREQATREAIEAHKRDNR